MTCPGSALVIPMTVRSACALASATLNANHLVQVCQPSSARSRLQIWRHQLKTAWRSSPYFIKGEAGGAGAGANPGNKKRKADYVESYRTAAAAAAGAATDEPSADAFAAGGEPPPTITLHPSFFPQELYTKQRR